MPLSVARWTSDHGRWFDLQRFVDEQGQTAWFEFNADWVNSTHTLVALDDETIIGFLHLVEQEIGPDSNRPSVTLNGVPLIEAKVMAFGVAEPARNRGVGRQLQEAAITLARDLGCHQLRSHSAGDNHANHALKLKMGFAVHPEFRDNDQRAAYFVMAL